MGAGFKIVTLPSGANTLRSLSRNETYHPCGGPLEEARVLHVEQNQLAERCAEKRKFVLWDVGLGAAGNSVSAISALEGCAADLEIHSFDKWTDPLEFALENSEALPYLSPYREIIAQLLAHNEVQVRPNLKWFFHRGDFCEQIERSDLPPPNSIFYDPYSPATNREMWTLAHFQKIFAHLKSDCMLSSYSRSTAVRVTLLLAGFQVGIGRSIENKAETTVAANRLELLKQPLTRKFLQRVKISGNAAPMRDPVYSITPILPEDLAALELHAQFAH
ncbi:MAG: MnmC family methyltransferase [Bacteriovoracia bacterium]